MTDAAALTTAIYFLGSAERLPAPDWLTVLERYRAVKDTPDYGAAEAAARHAAAHEFRRPIDGILVSRAAHVADSVGRLVSQADAAGEADPGAVARALTAAAFAVLCRERLRARDVAALYAPFAEVIPPESLG